MALGIVRQADQYGLDNVHAPGEYEPPPEEAVDPRRHQPHQNQSAPSSSSSPAAAPAIAARQGPRIHAGTMARPEPVLPGDYA